MTSGEPSVSIGAEDRQARYARPPSEPPPLSRLLSWIANPRGVADKRKLRDAVAGKVVLVTGASFGLGEATATMLAEAGAVTLIAARTHDKLEAVAAAARAAGGVVHSYPTDLADANQARALAQRVLAEHGHVDLLIHNAGKSLRRSIALSYDRYRDFERTMAINYHGPVALTLDILRSMRSRRRGHIINVSTVGVRIPPGPRWAAYQASKGAFDTWMRSAALEISPDGVRVTTIYMALMYTRMSAPTPIFRIAPGLMPAQAAHLIARAVVERPKEIVPPWLRPAEIGGVLLRRPLDWLMTQAALRTGDTAASLKAVEATSAEP